MEKHTEIIHQFIEHYTTQHIQEDVISFYNDAYMIVQYFLNNNQDKTAWSEDYKHFISHILAHQALLKEYTTFDFSTIDTWEKLQNSSTIESLTPIFTPYSFGEVEVMLDHMFEEIKAVKEFQKEIKEEIRYLLEEYTFHVNHLEENMKYNFYTYDELENVDSKEINKYLETFREEKKKFIQRCNDRLK